PLSMDVAPGNVRWPPPEEDVKRPGALEVPDHVLRHAIDGDVRADAEPPESSGGNVAHKTERQRIDVRVKMPMVEAYRMEAQQRSRP
ncbi:MAG: hypothetical protein ABI969_13465, partial [bacterium]